MTGDDRDFVSAGRLLSVLVEEEVDDDDIGLCGAVDGRGKVGREVEDEVLGIGVWCEVVPSPVN